MLSNQLLIFKKKAGVSVQVRSLFPHRGNFVVSDLPLFLYHENKQSKQKQTTGSG